jgi:3-deoxy-manno-octulosonate cytidylyltransferase (CMP-KDO synthetase)
MLEQVWSRAREASRIDRLIVATDDERIERAAAAFGAEVMMTAADHASGTDRVAEVVRRVQGEGARARVVLNVQGDEPLITPTALDRLVAAFDADPPPRMATLAEPVTSPEELFDPNVVKLVAGANGRALYFSRAPIPYHRGSGTRLDPDYRAALLRRPGGLAGYRKHQGIYAYDAATLDELTRLGPSLLERDEGLEQLRALEAGLSIQVVDSDFRSVSVDEPADLERVARVLPGVN